MAVRTVELFQCPLCLGLLVDAVVSKECCCRYCRSCITKHLEEAQNCPKCGRRLRAKDEFTADEELRQLINRAFRREYYAEYKRRIEYLENNSLKKSDLIDKDFDKLHSYVCSDDERISLHLKYVHVTSGNEVSVHNVDRMEIDGEHDECDKLSPTKISTLSFPVRTDRLHSHSSSSLLLRQTSSSSPTVALPHRITSQTKSAVWTKQMENYDKERVNCRLHFSRYLRCKANATLKSLRLYFESKMDAHDAYRLFFMDSSCTNVFEDWCTLKDVIEYCSWDRKGPFQLRFTLLRVTIEDKPPLLDLELMPELSPEEPVNHSHAVTSTTAVDVNSGSSLQSEMSSLMFPSWTVSLDSSMMAASRTSHQPIIKSSSSLVPQPPPRKKRKALIGTPEKQVSLSASSSTISLASTSSASVLALGNNLQSRSPVHRMIGVSPLEKSPPQMSYQNTSNVAVKKRISKCSLPMSKIPTNSAVQSLRRENKTSVSDSGTCVDKETKPSGNDCVLSPIEAKNLSSLPSGITQRHGPQEAPAVEVKPSASYNTPLHQTMTTTTPTANSRVLSDSVERDHGHLGTTKIDANCVKSVSDQNRKKSESKSMPNSNRKLVDPQSDDAQAQMIMELAKVYSSNSMMASIDPRVNNGICNLPFNYFTNTYKQNWMGERMSLVLPTTTSKSLLSQSSNSLIDSSLNPQTDPKLLPHVLKPIATSMLMPVQSIPMTLPIQLQSLSSLTSLSQTQGVSAACDVGPRQMHLWNLPMDVSAVVSGLNSVGFVQNGECVKRGSSLSMLPNASISQNNAVDSVVISSSSYVSSICADENSVKNISQQAPSSTSMRTVATTVVSPSISSITSNSLSSLLVPMQLASNIQPRQLQTAHIGPFIRN